MDDDEDDLVVKGDSFDDEEDDMENVTEEDEETDEFEDDDEPPFSEPGGLRSRLPRDHPSTDANIDEHELYDEGLDGASEADVADEDEPDE